ncbi:MAG: nucleoside phosphorylase [Nitrososphaeria archaeon]
MPMHIKADANDIAKNVLTVGNPERAKLLSILLENPRLVNTNREFYVYTGLYKGVPVSIVAHGIGAASATLVFDELSQVGVKKIVRLGTSGALKDEINVGDFVVSTGASYLPGGTIGEYVTEGFFVLAAVPDLILTKKVLDSLRRAGLRVHYGPTFSNDLFYSKYYSDELGILTKHGFLCAEMECASLMALSQIKGMRSACALLIVDNIVRGRDRTWTDEEELEKLIMKAGSAVLDALVED